MHFSHLYSQLDPKGKSPRGVLSDPGEMDHVPPKYQVMATSQALQNTADLSQVWSVRQGRKTHELHMCSRSKNVLMEILSPEELMDCDCLTSVLSVSFMISMT
jgi:hypothetical protein